MKIEQEKPVPPPFNPVTITLESREEVGILAALVGPTSTPGRVVAYNRQVWNYPAQYPVLNDERLSVASHSFSALYDRLNAALNNK